MSRRIVPSQPKRSDHQDGSLENEELFSFEASDLEKFLPSDFPQRLPDGRIPLRRQIFENTKILNKVLTRSKKGVFMCNHCDLLFNQFTELLDHFDEFKIKRPHKCSHDDCPWKIVGFNRLRQLTRHESSVHSNSTSFVCDKCTKKFGRIDLLNRHLKNVHENMNSRYNKMMAKLNRESSTETAAKLESTTSTESTPAPVVVVVAAAAASNTSSAHSSEDEQDPSSYKHSIDFLTS